MLILTGKIVENIEEKQIERFLKGKGYVRSEEEKAGCTSSEKAIGCYSTERTEL